MDRSPLVLLSALAAVAVVVAVAVLASAAAGRRTRAELRSCRAEIAALTARVDDLAHRSADPGSDRHEDYVITALPAAAAPVPPVVGDARVGAGFVSVATGESLVRLVSLAHGVRRALSPENRNRIRFEMRRELRRARKQRRRDIREAQRHLRTQPAAQRLDVNEEAA
jgi:hypothetical protein